MKLARRIRTKSNLLLLGPEVLARHEAGDGAPLRLPERRSVRTHRTIEKRLDNPFGRHLPQHLQPWRLRGGGVVARSTCVLVQGGAC